MESFELSRNCSGNLYLQLRGWLVIIPHLGTATRIKQQRAATQQPARKQQTTFQAKKAQNGEIVDGNGTGAFALTSMLRVFY